MSTFAGIMLILLVIDSIVLIVATAKQNWKLFGICLVLLGILDLALIKWG